MAKVIWTDSAIDDLAHIFDYLAERMQSVDRAEQFCLDLAGSLVHELAEWQAREIYRNSYRIIYVHRGDACYVNMCLHGSRDLARHIDRSLWDSLPP